MMKKEVIDLTHLLNENIPVYPGTIGPQFDSGFTVEKDGYAELKASMVLHSGTHIDAPSHILANGKPLDAFPIDKFMGEAMVINCENVKMITLEFLKKHEAKIKNVQFVLFYTGWQHKWYTNLYFNDCPALDTEAAKWLTQFVLQGIGIDAFSIDPIVSADKVTPETLPNHHILLSKDILLIENLTNLDKLPESVFQFSCLPLKIENADGSPVRAIAIL